MNIEKSLNEVFDVAWKNKIELKGIILDKKHKKQINNIVGTKQASIYENDSTNLVTIIYQ